MITRSPNVIGVGVGVGVVSTRKSTALNTNSDDAADIPWDRTCVEGLDVAWNPNQVREHEYPFDDPSIQSNVANSVCWLVILILT